MPETLSCARCGAPPQVFRDNMTEKGAPEVSACRASDNWTAVSFRPDLAKFGMAALTQATLALMRKRVYDLAGVLGKNVKARSPYYLASMLCALIRCPITCMRHAEYGPHARHAS